MANPVWIRSHRITSKFDGDFLCPKTGYISVNKFIKIESVIFPEM